MARFAAARGHRYSPEVGEAVPAELGELRLLRRGHGRKVGHTIRAAVPGVAPLVFEYSCEIGRGGARREWIMSVAAARREAHSPGFVVGPVEECVAAGSALGYRVVVPQCDFMPSGYAIAAEEPARTVVEMTRAGWPTLDAGECIECGGRVVAACRPGPLTETTADALIDRIRRWE